MQNKIEILAMFDSGANIPVWCSGEKIFKKAYPTAVKVSDSCLIAGFGKENDTGVVYNIPEFVLESGGTKYKLVNLYVAVCNKPQIGCTFILSDTMFAKTDTFIKRRKHKTLEIHFDKSEYICTSTLSPGFSISVWTTS